MKKIFLVFVLIFSQFALAKEFKLSNAKATYTVKHLLKTVKGESNELKGKMVCEKSQCDFLIAIPAKSFISSDSNRDLNMHTILDVIKFPLITVKGSIAEIELVKNQFDLKAVISLKGVEKEYILKISRNNNLTGNFVLLLENHKVERSSLLMVAIDNEVPIDFSFDWSS